MARSVYVPPGAVLVAYAAMGPVLDDDYPDAFDDCIELAADRIEKRYPSVCAADRWVGREGRVIAENSFAEFVVAEYCGLVSLSLVPKGGGLAAGWCGSVKKQFLEYAAGAFGDVLIKQGVFSNGEAFFQPKSGEQKGDMGLGYSSKEGWL